MTLDHPWTEPPAPADLRAVAPGIYWLRMPLPFQLNHINLWLLEDGDGWTIVDTGVGLDDTRALWERIFATHLDGRPVRRVLVTHFHPDHMGNAGWLSARWKTELWCTQAEWLYAQYAWRSRGAADFEPRLAHFRRHGCGPEALVQLGRRGNHYPSLVPEVSSEFRRIR
jgi:glyoxylase-like metal-dependent hydrolase (beta-lactamase superfamily II)